ncbi:AMP-dependent synthetase/ligase [Williamwhitmania taraxaci]|uniref:Long-chain acyl-CoA synthetase n=1 Tax=Williamwhitmania taraxaci TaxID=1640674 RepID=A0A1G6SEL6_9BACT|nr:AMP-binding protein [Williamwhitmania taraxaci]SDD15370.1 long-chain acyl-CoA synthetase [Williamwhitmania taraxaci]
MKTIIDLFEESVNKFNTNPFLWEKKESEFKPTTYSETKVEVDRLTAGLIAIGIVYGDRVALLSEGRNLWIISELALLQAGAINVPLSVKLEESNELQFRIEHSEASVIICSANQLPKIRATINKLPLVKTVVILDQTSDLQPGEMTIGDVLKKGDELLLSKPNAVAEAKAMVKPNDYANISYTSGTTADPKGIILSHRNYTANVEQALTLMEIPTSFKTLIILPLDHCFAHVGGFYSFMAKGASVATVQVGRTPLETLKNIPINIKEIKPDLLLSVPALAKNFRKNIEGGIRAKGPMIEKLFNHAMKISYAYNKEGYNKGRGLVIAYKPLMWLYDKILFTKIRENFGGELKFFIGGGALLDIDLQRFFYAIGVPMFQGYGLSEATPIISSNSLKRHKLGSSGYLVDYLDLKIVDANGNSLPIGEKGEIVIKGENVMIGYWKNEKATAESIKDGWLYTGDLGFMDVHGFLHVLGRFKSLLIGSDGEKYSPEGIEETMVEHSKLIDQAMLHNNQNAYTVALLVPNKEALKRHITKAGLTWGTTEAAEEAIKAVQAEINRFKKGGDIQEMFPDRWLPTTFALLPEPFTEHNHMLNSTMKMVRGKIEKHYAESISFLFTAEGKTPINSKNIKTLM